MIGIERIASYIPPGRIINSQKYPQIPMDHIQRVVGVLEVAQMSATDQPSDLCAQAFAKLCEKKQVDISQVQLIVVVTQHSGPTIPPISTEVHGLIEAPESTICFDISVGCSGYVQGLSVVLAYMNGLGIKNALLFNVETLSRVSNDFDVDLRMLFGDAATVTVLSDKPILVPVDYSFGTNGKLGHNLKYRPDGLIMKGLGVYDFVIRSVPNMIRQLLQKNSTDMANIDFFAFHQASKRTIDSILRNLKIDSSKAPFHIARFGNTGSCSIPILIENEIEKENLKTFLLCGFGAGMAWAAAIFKKV